MWDAAVDNGNLDGLFGKVRGGRSTMKGMIRLGILVAALSLALGCSHNSDLSRPAVVSELPFA